MFEEDDIADDEQEIAYPEYTAENFLDDVYMSEDNYTRLVGLLRNKKNIILQGAPGERGIFVTGGRNPGFTRASEAWS